MKAILCGLCGDIKALRSEHSVTCECGNLTGWWVDDRRGIAKFSAKNKDKAKVVGIHNGLIQKSFEAYDYSPEKWKEIHEELCQTSPGYAFMTRGCPVIIAGIGNSNDTSWEEVNEDEPEEHNESEEQPEIGYEGHNID